MNGVQCNELFGEIALKNSCIFFRFFKYYLMYVRSGQFFRRWKERGVGCREFDRSTDDTHTLTKTRTGKHANTHTNTSKNKKYTCYRPDTAWLHLVTARHCLGTPDTGQTSLNYLRYRLDSVWLYLVPVRRRLATPGYRSATAWLPTVPARHRLTTPGTDHTLLGYNWYRLDTT